MRVQDNGGYRAFRRFATGILKRKKSCLSRPWILQASGPWCSGGLGHGLAMKLINNMLGQIATVAIAEPLVFGKKAGLDSQKIYEVVRVSTGSSVQFENRVPRMLARNFM